MEEDQIRSAVLDAFEVSLDAQLRAVRRLKQGKAERPRPRQGMSQVDMANDILRRAGKPLHVSEIIDRIESVHGQRLDRESLVSALVQKVKREYRFTRPDHKLVSV